MVWGNQCECSNQEQDCCCHDGIAAAAACSARRFVLLVDYVVVVVGDVGVGDNDVVVIDEMMFVNPIR